MVKIFFKKILISIAALTLVLGCLQFEFSQKAIIKILIKTLTPYKASGLEIKSTRKFPFSANIQSVILLKDKKYVAVLKNVQWSIASLLCKGILLSVDQCKVTTESSPVDFDFSGISPSIIASFLQKTTSSLLRFSAIHIKNLQINNKNFSMRLKHKADEWVIVLSHNMEDLILKLSSLNDHSSLQLEGFLNGQNLTLSADVYEKSIDFSAQTSISSFVNEKLCEFFGKDILINGHLEKENYWQLRPLKIETSKGHTIEGQCTQHDNNLKGEFIWIMPLADSKQAKCVISLGGITDHPILKWEFKEGIAPLEKAFGECTVVDSNHIKLLAKLHHDVKNTASIELEISLNPFLVNGDSKIDVENLQKFLQAFWPDAKGNLNFKASLENVSSFEKGRISISGQGAVGDCNFYLPIDIDIQINDGLGEGKLNLKKGHFQKRPLDANISFTSTSKEIHIAKCDLQLQDLHLSLLKPTSYNFENGLDSTKMQFCGGTIECEKLKIDGIENSVAALYLRNIQLKGLKIIFGDQDIAGILNGHLIKYLGKPLSLKLDISKCFWQQHHDKQTHKILNNLVAVLDAQFENHVLKWNLKIKDHDKINLETLGQANIQESTIDAHIKGTTKLKLLADWLATDDRISGDIAINIRAKGLIATPVYEGTINADNGLYENSEVGTFYQNITIRTKAQGKRLMVLRFDAQDVTKSTDMDQGYLHGAGWIDFSEPLSPVFNVPVRLLHVRIAQNDSFVGDASGILTFIGKGAEVGCKGEVTIENASYFIEQSGDVKIPKIVDRNSKKNKVKKSKQYSTVFPLDILIHTPPGSFKVLGSGADSIWKGDFYVKKSIVNPFLVGRVVLHEGTLDILGKVLHITHGEITFVDDDRNNPRLDIRAIKNLDGAIVVAVEIKGTSDKTIVDFTSTPSMPKEEILALLLFGKKLGEVSVLQSVQLAELAKADDSGSGFFEKMRSNFGFDQFEFKTSSRGHVSENDEDITPQERAETKTSQAVRIGKEFGKVQIAIEQGAGSETSKVVVSTPLGKNLALQGDVGAAQNNGIGLSWIKRY